MSTATRAKFWAHAGAFGALWGALEATVGSFLHALKIPFAGVLLASMGAALLIAVRTLVPRPGILLATGAICAGVKLASPATMLLGPAVGILTESLLAELMTLPFGANPLSAALAGALGALWSVCQKVLTQIVLGGAPIVALYKELLQRGSKMLGIDAQVGLRLVLGFVALLMVWGALAALAGLRAGRRALRGELEEAPAVDAPPADLPSAPQLKESRGRLVLVTFLCIVHLVALVCRDRLPAPPAVVVPLVVAFVCARSLRRRVGKPRSWSFALLVLLVLGALLGPKEAHMTWSREGSAQAFVMIQRALSLVLLSQALLSMLPPPRADASPFQRALCAALQALPELTRTLGAALRARRARGTRSPFVLLLGVLDDAVVLAARSARAEPPERLR